MIRWLYQTLVRRIGPGVIPWLRSLGLAEPPGTQLDLSEAGDCFEVHDRGSDITVFAFAGMAAQHGGMVNYEFKGLLQKHGGDFNIVFVRDIRCAAYQLTPTNEVGGAGYFASGVQRAMEKLGARINVSLGTSSGATAALEFAARCGMDLALAFSPTWPPENYDIPHGVRGFFSQLALLLRRPGCWLERYMLYRTGKTTLRMLHSRMTPEEVTDPLRAYREFGAPSRTRLYYGDGMGPDRLSSIRFELEPGVQLVPVHTDRHNTTGVLKREGRLGSEIVDQVGAIAAEIRNNRHPRPVRTEPPEAPASPAAGAA